MTEQKNVQSKNILTQRQKFARTALTAAFVLLVLLDVALFVISEKPDDTVVLAVAPLILISVILAYMGRTNFAVGLFGLSLGGAMAYLTVINPQGYVDLTALTGRYLFPLIMFIPIAWFSLEKRVTKIAVSAIAFAVMAGLSLMANLNDANPTNINNPATEIMIQVVLVVTVIGLIVLVFRNFSDISQWYLNLQLRYKLIGTTVIIVVIGLAALTVVNTTQTSTVLEENVRQALAGEALRIGSKTGEVLETQIDKMNTFALFGELRNSVVEQNNSYEGSQAEILNQILNLDSRWVSSSDTSNLVSKYLYSDGADVLRELKAEHPEFVEVFITDIYGGLVATSDRTSDFYQADEAWWQEAYNNGNGSTYLGDPELDESTGTYSINLAVPIYKPNSKEIIGVLRTTYDITALFDTITSGGSSTGVSNEMVFIGNGSHLKEGGLENLNEKELAAVQSFDNSGFSILEWGGDQRAASIYSIKSDLIPEITAKGWLILTSELESVVFAPVQSATRTGIVIAAIVALLASAIAAFLGQQIAVPVLNLTEVAQEFASGNYNVRSDVNSQDEIGKLSNAFNRMAEEVGNQTVVLAERAREMEASQRVTFAASERTTPDDFLDLLVNLIVDQFDVYHSQIYMVDEENKNAVLSKSTGYAGRVLLQRKHRIPLERESLVTRCIQTGEPVLVGNTTADEGWLANELLPYTQSELVVPITVDGQVIGALDIQAREANRFTDETVPVFESMIEQVAFLYQNNTLLESIEEAQSQQQQFVKQLETASQVAGELTSILDPTQLLDQAVSMLQSNFNFYHAHIYLLDEAGEKLTVQSGSGHVGVILKERGHSIPVEAEKSFVATALRERMPVRVNDTTQDPNWLPNPLLPDTRSELAVPLITRGQVIGVLDIQAEEVGRFTEVDEDTMLTLAGQLATSVDTARLFVDVEHTAERDRMRFELAEAFSGNLTVDEVWNVLQERALEGNVSIVFSKAENLPDGDKELTIVRAKSNTPKLTPAPMGYKLRFSENPEFVARVGFGDFSIMNNIHTDPGMQADPQFYEDVKVQGVNSIMSAWLGDSRDNVIGFMAVQSPELDFFDADTAGMYQSLIELGTIALRSAMLRATIARAAAETATRLEVTEALAGNLTEDEILDVLVEKAALYQDARISLYYEYDANEMHFLEVQRDEPFNTGMPAFDFGFRITTEMSEFKNYLNINEPTIFGDINTDERLDEPTRKLMQGVGYTSLATFPMQMAEDWLGYIFVSAKVENYFDEQKQALYNVLAEVGENALRAARLRSAVARAAQLTSTRLEVTQALAGNPSEDEVLDALIEKMGTIEGSAVAVYYEDLTQDVRKITSMKGDAFKSGTEVLPPGTVLVDDEVQFASILPLNNNLIINNLEEDETIQPTLKGLLASLNIVSLASFPMQVTDKLAAHLFLATTKPNFYTEEIVTLGNIVTEAGEVALRSAQLREQREAERKRFEALVTYAPDAILLLDYETYQWMDANKNAEAMFGMSREELLKIGPAEVSPEYQPDGRETGEKAVELISAAVAGGASQFDWVHKNADGKEFDCEIRLALLPGAEKQLLVNITDITDRKQAQQAIVQGDRLKSEFLANMSHELRTPLNSILGYTDVLLMGLDGDLEDDVRIDLEAIHENSQHLLRLINDILDLAKIEAGRMTLSLGDVNIPQVLDELKRNNAGLLVGKDVDLVVDAPEDLPVIVADERRVYQVVNNLVSNAAKFTEKGSITMRAFEDNGEMVLQVEDTGMGISKENLEAIFEEFTQVDNSSTRQHEGTGLGLTITRRLVHMHGGAIGVESEFGKGSTFSVRLPLKAKVAPELLTVVNAANGSNGSSKKKVKK